MPENPLQLTPEHRARVEAFQRKHHLGLLALVFTDLVGSTRLKQDLGDVDAVALIKLEHAAIRELLRAFPDDEEIGTAGDSFFLVFSRPSDAVRFALRLHARDRELVPTVPQLISTRVGIHVGEVLITEGDEGGKTKDIFGMQVDACARIMSLAAGGQTLLSRFAFDNARQMLRGGTIPGVGSLAWVNHGEYDLAGLEAPLEICEVGETGFAPLKLPKDTPKAHRHAGGNELVLGWRPAAGQPIPGTHWVLGEKLGEGGFGEVWVARHEKLKDLRVFKFCFRADRVRSLKRELTLFRVLKERVGEHPNVVAIHDVNLDEAPYYLAIEYVPGHNLKAWWKERQGAGAPPDRATCLELVAQIADALQVTHAAGIIHRDVKPTNILVVERGAETRPVQSSPENRPLTGEGGVRQPRPGGVTAKLTDFGIGQVVSAEVLGELTRLGFTATLMSPGSSLSGTQMYMAPELMSGKSATPQSDLYSLGVVLYQLLVGDLDRPVTGDWMEEIADPLLRADLRGCLAGQPENRFRSAGDLAARLRDYPTRALKLEEERSSAQAAEAAARRLARRRTRQRRVLAATVALLILGALWTLARDIYLNRFGGLIVATNPPGIAVWSAGRLLGRTPYVDQKLPVGVMELELRGSDGFVRKTTVEVRQRRDTVMIVDVSGSATNFSVMLSPPIADAPIQVVVKGISGKVEARRSGSPAWEPATAGLVLHRGDSLRTGAGARAFLDRGDGEALSVGERSELTVSTNRSTNGPVTGVIEMRRGYMFFHRTLPPGTTNRLYDIRTPAGTFGIRG